RDSVAAEALWQRVSITDAWYESTRRGKGARDLGSDSLARAVIAAGDALLERFPHHPNAADLTWRQGNLAFAHGQNERAAADFARMKTQYPADARTPRAALLQGEALFRIARYEDAGAAYEE